MPLACKLRAAVFANQLVISSAVHPFRVSIPPCHAADIRAEIPFSMMRRLLQRLQAVSAEVIPLCNILIPHGMSGAKGLYGVQRQSRQSRYFLVPVALVLEFHDSATLRFCHSGASFLRNSVSRYTQRKDAFVRVKWAKK